MSSQVTVFIFYKPWRICNTITYSSNLKGAMVKDRSLIGNRLPQRSKTKEPKLMLILLRGPQLLRVKIQTGQNELYLAIVLPHVNRQSKTVLYSRFRATDSGLNYSRWRYSGFRSPGCPDSICKNLLGFRIGQAKISLIPKSGIP